jgi:glycosyltransferase involved in cell wall biosynthesis
MRVAYVCADRGIPLGDHKGASVHLRSLAAALARRPHDVMLVCHSVAGDNPPPRGVRIEVMPPDDGSRRQWLTRLLADARSDVLLERYSLSTGPAFEAARELGLEAVLEVNAPLVDEAARYRGLEGAAGWRRWERRVLTAADRVIVVSPALQDHVVSCGVSRERVAVIPNGVDVRVFADAKTDHTHLIGLPQGRIVAGFVGSFKPWQDVAGLVRAVAVLPDIHLLLVGDGPQRLEVEELVAASNLRERVTFTGAVLHDTLPSLLAAMDIGTAPFTAHPDFYFSPLKINEYLAAGLPVVASDLGGLADLIGEAGVIVPPGDIDELAAAIGRLATDAKRRRQMSRAATRLALALDWSTVAEKVEAVLRPQAVIS